MAISHMQRVLEILRTPEGDCDLAEAALLIAKEEYPALDVQAYLGKLQSLARRAGKRLPANPSLGDIVFTLNELLFQEEGFGGNHSDYYHPNNNFLNHVLDTRRGIPITLAMIYICVGRSLGLPVEALAFPGHFLVRFLTDDGTPVILDPYAGGAQLFKEDLDALLFDVYGSDVPGSTPEIMIKAADKQQVVLRMLRNLKNTYLRQRRLDKALWATNYMLQIAPLRPQQWRERGRLYEKLDYRHGAAADYRRYLELDPDAADRDEVRRRLRSLQSRSVPLH